MFGLKLRVVLADGLQENILKNLLVRRGDMNGKKFVSMDLPTIWLGKNLNRTIRRLTNQ